MTDLDTRKENAPREQRLAFLDNLRTFMVFLVILCHAGGVYENSGFWAFFWIVDDPATNPISGYLILILDIFMMSTLFFISGYGVPVSLRRMNARRFVQTKLRRLLLPWGVAVLTLIPLYKVIFLASRDLPQERWTSYFHFSNGLFSQSWLWFLPVLFVFQMLYLIRSQLPFRIPKPSLKTAVLGVLAAATLYSIGMDRAGLQGWTKNGWLNFQNERVLIYFLSFLLGAHCCRLETFHRPLQRPTGYRLAITTIWIPVTLYIVFLLHPLYRPGQALVSNLGDRLILWFCFNLAWLGFLYVSIETFRRYFHRRTKLRNELNRNSYYVYIIHVIVMGSIAMGLLHTAMPSLLKFLVLTVSTYAASHLAVVVVRRCIAPRQREVPHQKNVSVTASFETA